MLNFETDETIIEIGVDEAGRGPLFGRVYCSAVIMPKSSSLDFSNIKDSKKFHSKKKINEVAEFIKTNSLAWAVEYADESTIDSLNILQTTIDIMHKAILKVIEQLSIKEVKNVLLCIDGSYFKPLFLYDKELKKPLYFSYKCITSGDNKNINIAAASILAKTSRDQYIEDLCKEQPDLMEKYDLQNNKGYGSKKHLQGIETYGITSYHRKTFGICKKYA
jgi:ribonuclease HII